MRLRVVVYNVRGFRDGADRVAAVLRQLRPDLLLMNESGGRLRLRRFASDVGMDLAPDPWSPLRRRVKNAILVRAPWRILEHRLHRFRDSVRWYPRGALVGRIERSGAEVGAVCVHLGVDPAERRRHVGELTGLVERLGGPVLVGGDLNELPQRRATTTLGERVWDAWLLGGDVAGETFPAHAPTARIDFLFVSEGVRVERAMVPATPEARTASDHRPVVVEVSIAEPEVG